MSTVRRLDRSELKKKTKMANGWLKVDAHLTRVGVFEYANDDGSKRRELRLPEEVFKPAALASFSMVPITDEHPPEFLDATNTRGYQRGTVAQQVSQDDDHVRAELMITDAELVAKMETGDAQEISCGYNCRLDFTPGVHNGHQYDAIQRDITGNHVAVVPRGRAGPSARARMDALEGIVIPIHNDGSASNPNQESKVKRKITINGISFEVDEQVAQAFDALTKAHGDALAKMHADLKTSADAADKATAAKDSAEEKLKKLDAEMKELPAKLSKDAKVRVELETKARQVLGAKAKLDGLKVREIHELALEKLRKGVDLSEKSDAYVEGRFDDAFSEWEAKHDRDADDDAENREKVHGKVKAKATADKDDADDEEEHDDAENEDDLDADAARAKMMKDSKTRWQRTKPADA